MQASRILIQYFRFPELKCEDFLVANIIYVVGVIVLALEPEQALTGWPAGARACSRLEVIN